MLKDKMYYAPCKTMRVPLITNQRRLVSTLPSTRQFYRTNHKPRKSKELFLGKSRKTISMFTLSQWNKLTDSSELLLGT